MKKLFLPLLIIVLLIGCSNKNQKADAVFVNGNIYTVNAQMPQASEMAVANGIIIYIGDKIPEDLLNVNTKTIDLNEKLVMPGFIDSHLHFMDGGYSLSRIDLRDAGTKEEFVHRIAEYAKSIPEGEWILSGNWDHTNWQGQPLPERWWIDDVTPKNPVFINRLDGHMALANSLALDLAGITNDVQTPPGGVIVRNKKGQITGILKEAAKELVGKVIPEPGMETNIRAAKAAVQHLLENGITSAHDMGLWSHFQVYDTLLSMGDLNVRISLFPPIPEWDKLKNYSIKNKNNGFLSVKGAKAFMDGSLGSSTAKFFKSYLGDPENFGVWDEQMIPPEKMLKRMKGVHDLGLQIATHAIGTEANNTLLNMYEDLLKGKSNRRFRIEHAQHLLPGDIGRFAKIGVIASMQPYHCIDDGRWAETRIDYERCKTTYAFRDLIDNDAVVAFGSDWDVAPVSPIWGIYAAVTRQTLDGKNPDGWVPEQKITVEEAIKCYTVNGAYADFSENVKGSLETGKYADFVVLSDNILSIDKAAIKDVDVIMTIVGGEIVYKNEKDFKN